MRHAMQHAMRHAMQHAMRHAMQHAMRALFCSTEMKKYFSFRLNKMSLLKWKKMAVKRSKTGQVVNNIRETIEQKKITDMMSNVEAEKLFKPITSGLKELAKPQPIKRRLQRKKLEVPDYGIAIDDEVPDYGLEDLFGDQVLPENTKQLVPKPPSYDDVLKDLETGEKKIYVNPEYMLELEDPPEYEEDKVPDYEIFEEDRINETLDKLGLTNYDDIEAQLKREDMTEKTRRSFLSKKIENAVKKRQQLPGYKTQITKQLNKGLISPSEAQIRRKVFDDARKVLNDYINFNKNKLKIFKGSGLKGKKTKRGGNAAAVFINPQEAVKKLGLIVASIDAGNNSIELRNTGVAILDILLRNYIISKDKYNKIYKNFFSV